MFDRSKESLSRYIMHTRDTVAVLCENYQRLKNKIKQYKPI